jgi:hypothetical protein
MPLFGLIWQVVSSTKDGGTAIVLDLVLTDGGQGEI